MAVAHPREAAQQKVPLSRDITQQRKTSLRHDAKGAVAAAGRDPVRSFACGTFALLGLAALILLPPAARATTYKWVDDKGVIHYSDKMPPEAINKGNVELNKQGVPIRKTDPALTAEQRRAREAEEDRARQAQKVRDDVQRRDRALLQTYTTESEIDLSKSRALSTIDGQMQSALAYTATLNKRKQEVVVRMASFGDKPPPTLERELANVDEELAKQADLIAAKRKEITVVTARYDADKQRWREIRTIAEAAAGGAAVTGGTPVNGGNGGTIPTANKK
jgi:hypothetical protein